MFPCEYDTIQYELLHNNKLIVWEPVCTQGQANVIFSLN